MFRRIAPGGRAPKCERYIPDADRFVTTAKTSGEQMAMHRLCASRILSAMKPPALRQG